MKRRPEMCVCSLEFNVLYCNLFWFSQITSSFRDVTFERATSAREVRDSRRERASAITAGFHALSQLGLRSGTPTLTLT